MAVILTTTAKDGIGRDVVNPWIKVYPNLAKEGTLTLAETDMLREVAAESNRNMQAWLRLLDKTNEYFPEVQIDIQTTISVVIDTIEG